MIQNKISWIFQSISQWNWNERSASWGWNLSVTSIFFKIFWVSFSFLCTKKCTPCLVCLFQRIFSPWFTGAIGPPLKITSSVKFQSIQKTWKNKKHECEVKMTLLWLFYFSKIWSLCLMTWRKPNFPCFLFFISWDVIFSLINALVYQKKITGGKNEKNRKSITW